MSRPEHPWPADSGPHSLTKSFITPRMASSAPNRIHAYYPPTLKYSSWSSEFVRGGTNKGRVTSKRDRVVQRTTVSKQQKGTRSRCWASFKELFPGSNRKKGENLDALTLPFVPSDRWKAHGYFPRPAVNRVQVRNSMPRRLPSTTVNPDDFWSSLRGTNDSQRLANRPGRMERLTSQPPLHDWSRVQRPLAHDVRLNPYLQHRCNSPHPITFDIALGPNKITYNTHESATMPLDLAHFAQPATYPPVVHMRINTVADDPLPHFPWAIKVRNARGITCGDVFYAISHSFLEYVTEAEYNSWTSRRKKMAARAYYSRVRAPLDPARPGNVTGLGDGLRRIDYIGKKILFRGLEQASSLMRDGAWLMYFGSDRSRAFCFGADSMNKV